jgi:hypothetical protein
MYAVIYSLIIKIAKQYREPYAWVESKDRAYSTFFEHHYGAGAI